MASYEKADFWSKKAKKEGYPARSVYKLEEISNKFKILGTESRVLDLGASPGSWSLWILNKIKQKGFLISVDLKPLNIKPTASNFKFIQGDFTKSEILLKLKESSPFSLILSDAAPSTTGVRIVDQAASENLVRSVIDISNELAAKASSLVIKIFQGSEVMGFTSDLKQLYKKVTTFKPIACRNESFETYIVAIERIVP